MTLAISYSGKDKDLQKSDLIIINPIKKLAAKFLLWFVSIHPNLKASIIKH